MARTKNLKTRDTQPDAGRLADRRDLVRGNGTLTTAASVTYDDQDWWKFEAAGD